ncbi:MAG: flagellin, partial [Halobacteriales archaeon]|nr:flagellin [Halobacteriales archaeon]
MGFSVSGSFAIIVIGTFIAFGMFYGSAANAVEQVTDAQQAAHHDRLEQYNTAINVTRAEWQTGGDCGTGNTCLLIDIQNEGTTTLSTDATDVFVDG